MTVSKTEAITAWRAICSAIVPAGGTHAPGYTPRIKHDGGEKPEAKAAEAGEVQQVVPVQPEPQGADAEADTSVKGLKDGRDVYLLRYESERMLRTGRWVEDAGERVMAD
jgi:hypothetical protein